MLILSRYSIIHSELFPLPTLINSRGESRILAITEVGLPGGATLIFANTHLNAQPDPVNRQLQMKAIVEITGRYEQTLILAGDFNVEPGSGVIDLLDQYFTRTCNPCEPTIPALQPAKAIDFIAFTKLRDFTILSHQVIFEKYVSDHLPIGAELLYLSEN